MTDHTLGIWEGIIPEPDLPTEGDTEPNATDWEYECGYDTRMGCCDIANTDHCEGSPYRMAIGDVSR